MLQPLLKSSFIAVIVTLAVAADDDFVIVETENGPLRGINRGEFYAFEGIPYAKAPLGELRFAPSELNDERWEEPKDALEPGPNCLQWSHLVDGEDRSTGEEDCLFLNIYTRSLGVSEKPVPTIFFIHGGAFMFGHGDHYRPDHMLKNDLILITFNYRLGPLGFLSTEDDIIPGNYGLKDQVTALKWVRKNIANFGGHADKITLSGFSAGSASVQLHYLSPQSRGLFKNGIGHSGSALNPWVLTEKSAEKARKIASAVECSTESSVQMLKCLREKPALDIVRAVGQLFDFLYNPFSPVGVVIEKQSKLNPRPFLADHPHKLMKTGKFYRVPLILSVAEAEGLYPGAEFISQPDYLNAIHKNWTQLLPSILDYQTSVDDEARRNEISQMIRKRYLGRRMLSDNSFKDFIRIISNRLYFAGLIRSSQLMQAYAPIYLYYMTFKTEFSVGELLSHTTDKNYGVAHGEDVFLLFPPDWREEIPYTAEELLMADRFVNMYELFARDEVAKFGTLDIPRMDKSDMVRFLQINHPKSEPKYARQLSDEDFWNQLDFNDGMPVARAPKTEL